MAVQPLYTYGWNGENDLQCGLRSYPDRLFAKSFWGVGMAKQRACVENGHGENPHGRGAESIFPPSSAITPHGKDCGL